MWVAKPRTNQYSGVWNDVLEVWLVDIPTGNPQELPHDVAQTCADNFNDYTNRKKA